MRCARFVCGVACRVRVRRPFERARIFHGQEPSIPSEYGACLRWAREGICSLNEVQKSCGGKMARRAGRGNVVR